MTKHYIDVEWSDVLRKWTWAVQTEDEMKGYGSAPFRWLAKRRAINRLLEIKAAKDEADRNKDRALWYEVEL